MLEIKPDMTTKEIAEMIFGRIVEYKSKEYSSVYRSLVSIEKKGYIQRVQVQLRWRRSDQHLKTKVVAQL
jgi:predicted transcriptional regulator